MLFPFLSYICLINFNFSIMKINNLLLILLCSTSFGFSQITINSTNMPEVNDTLRMSRAVLDAGIDFQTTGADYTWDFSNLQNNNQKLNTYSPVSSSGQLTQFVFGALAGVNHKATYYLPNEDLPLNNLPAGLPITFSDVNQFLKVMTDSLTMPGLSMKVNGQAIPAKADIIETKYKFPLNFGDSHTSRGYINLDLNPIYDAKWRQHRKRDTEVDGWGEITTPFGTFSVLRIHHRIVESDSFQVSFAGFNNWIGIPVPVMHEYEWRSSAEKEPILLIKTTENAGIETVTSIEYRNEFILGVEENTLNFSVYPNPTANYLVVESKSENGHFQILTPDGRIVQRGTLLGNYQIIDVGSLAPGSYWMKINSGTHFTTKSFVKN